MNIFKKISLFNKASKAIKEIKTVVETNSETADKIKEVVEDLINVLNRFKELIPIVDKFVEEIIDIIKKWFKK